MKYKKHNITARKFEGDDLYSWAVFIDGEPIVTGLGRSEVDYYKKRAKEIIDRREQEDVNRIRGMEKIS